MVAGKRAFTTTQPHWQATANNESLRQMMRVTTKRARVARAMVMAMRVPGNMEDKGGKGHSVGNECGMQQRGPR